MRLSTIENLLYPVEREVDPINRKRHILRNGLTGRYIATVSDKYELVQNADVVRPLLDRFGEDAFTEARELQNGSFMFKIKTGRSFEIGGDRLDEQLICANSYNKSRILTWMYGAFKLLCSNGMFTGTAVINIRQKHIGSIPVKENVDKVIKSIGSNGFELWKKMDEVKLSDKHMINLISRMPILDETPQSQEKKKDWVINNMGKSRWVWNRDPEPRINPMLNRMIKGVAIRKVLHTKDNPENPRTAWGVFNQVNWAIERVMNPSEVNKKILANINAEKSISKAFCLN